MPTERFGTALRAYFLPMRLKDGKGNVFCLLSHNQIVEILGPRYVQPIPHSPAYLKGLLPYRDRLLPVISLDDLCNGQRTDRGESPRQLVVVRTGSINPVDGEPLKAVLAAYSRVQLIKLSGKELASSFKVQEAPFSLRNSGVLRGYFQQSSYAVAVCDFGPVTRGTLGAGWGRQEH